MQLIDANVIIRCILDDCPEMTSKAIEGIDNGAYTKPEIISEVVYVLQKVYSIQRPQIKSMVNDILDVITCTEEECIRTAMDIYSSISLDFVDCLLIAYHKINKENIFSFDKKLNKHLDWQNLF
jgi:predicted nucleic-acid-binding protein